jgi:hypothetical protein
MTRDSLLAKKEGNLIHAIIEVNILPMPANIDYRGSTNWTYFTIIKQLSLKHLHQHQHKENGRIET